MRVQLPILHLPMYHPTAAHQAANDAIAKGHRLFAMPAGDSRRGRMLSDPEYAPLWRSLDKARAFLMLHPAGACDTRLSRFSLTNLLGGPTETAIAAAHLTMSGVDHRRRRQCGEPLERRRERRGDGPLRSRPQAVGPAALN